MVSRITADLNVVDRIAMESRGLRKVPNCPVERRSRHPQLCACHRHDDCAIGTCAFVTSVRSKERCLIFSPVLLIAETKVRSWAAGWLSADLTPGSSGATMGPPYTASGTKNEARPSRRTCRAI